ncbi:MAG: hypothetical protein N2712_05525 [Brevinematales bacterium]|nr:hypothetical protein [Brevinematales bacterium]
MDSKFIKWLLLVMVILIWANAVRVSIPVIMDYLGISYSVDISTSEYVISGDYSKSEDVVDVGTYFIRNPFSRPFDSERVSSTKLVSKVQDFGYTNKKSVFSFFNLRGTFFVNDQRVAILEGRSDLGIVGTFYAKVGDIIMNEKVVDIGENYVIIFKDGEKVVLYEVR